MFAAEVAVVDQVQQTGVRIAELIASLSLAIDLGVGEPTEWMMKSALVAVRLAKAAGYDEATQRAAYYLGLVRLVGCTSTSARDAEIFGDELAVAELMTADFADPGTMALFARIVGRNQPPILRAALIARTLMAMGGGVFLDNHRRHCEGAAILAARLGLDSEIQSAIQQTYERWDGKGTPNGVAGEAIRPAMRAVHLAHVVGHYHTVSGVPAAIAVAEARSGTQFDPALVKVLAQGADAILAPFEGPLFDTLMAEEPGTPLVTAGTGLDTALEAIADFADQKIPQTIGHSRRVAAVAEAAARLTSLPRADVDRVRRAGLIHDLGRVGVSARILSKPGPLSAAEWERVRLHPYLTERVFAQSTALRDLGILGAKHHERLDGSGYHRGVSAPQLDAAARILAAANSFVALTEDRPHRMALSHAAAAKRLADDAKPAAWMHVPSRR